MFYLNIYLHLYKYSFLFGVLLSEAKAMQITNNYTNNSSEQNNNPITPRVSPGGGVTYDSRFPGYSFINRGGRLYFRQDNDSQTRSNPRLWRSWTNREGLYELRGGTGSDGDRSYLAPVTTTPRNTTNTNTTSSTSGSTSSTLPPGTRVIRDRNVTHYRVPNPIVPEYSFNSGAGSNQPVINRTPIRIAPSPTLSLQIDPRHLAPGEQGRVLFNINDNHGIHYDAPVNHPPGSPGSFFWNHTTAPDMLRDAGIDFRVVFYSNSRQIRYIEFNFHREGTFTVGGQNIEVNRNLPNGYRINR